MAGRGCWGKVLCIRHWEQSGGRSQTAIGALAQPMQPGGPVCPFKHLSSASAVMSEENFAACLGCSRRVNAL